MGERREDCNRDVDRWDTYQDIPEGDAEPLTNSKSFPPLMIPIIVIVVEL